MKSELATINHRISQRKYTHLDLEEDEFVELEMHRCKAGLVMIWVVAGIFILLLGFLMFHFIQRNNIELNETSFNKTVRIVLLIALGSLCPISLFFSAILTYIYRRNVMYITNHRAIQFVKSSPFSQSKNIIELSSVIDASYKKRGPLQYIFKYGTLYLATVVDEKNCTFPFLHTPTDELDTISHLVHQEKERKK